MGSLNLLPLSLLSSRRPATDAEYAKWLAASQMPGAPADFGGAVFPNPDGIQVSSDTDSGIPVTRLPSGVTLQHGAWHGATPTDISNPPKAELSTTAAKTSPIDFSKYEAAPAAGKIDFSKYESPSATSEPPADYLTRAEDRIDEVAKTAARAVGSAWDTITGIPGAVVHAAADPPTPAELKALGLDKPTGPGRVANFIQRMIGGGQVSEAARFYKQYYDATPDQRRDMETEMLTVAPEAIGAGAGAALTPALVKGAPGAIKATVRAGSEAASAIADAASSAGDTLRTAVKTGSKAVQAIDPDIVGIVSPRAAHSLKVAQRAAKVANKYATGATETAPVYPGATEPTATLEQLNPSLSSESRTLPGQISKERIFGPKPTPAASIPARQGLRLTGEVEAPSSASSEGVTSRQTASASEVTEQQPPETVEQVLRRSGTPAEFEKALNDALGGKPLQKGVSLKDQVPAKEAAATSLPEGFTPVKSSVLRGYKYDSATQQMEAITNSGQHYVHGEVTPELAETFKASDSKGVAWNKLRQSPGVVQVAKVINGKRVASVPGSITSESGAVIPKSKAGMQSPVMQKAEQLSDFIRPQKTLKDLAKPAAPSAPAAEPDLLTQLEQSLDQVKAKAGVATTATPSDLLDRWGVDPKSFAAGREQTRGMSAQDSAAAIDKIAEGYKQGKTIEPVIEVRDAQNNLIEVDGRSRVLAAHKAGIKRVPIIVRRLQ